jgi:hypothetical protein
MADTFEVTGTYKGKAITVDVPREIIDNKDKAGLEKIFEDYHARRYPNEAGIQPGLTTGALKYPVNNPGESRTLPPAIMPKVKPVDLIPGIDATKGMTISKPDLGNLVPNIVKGYWNVANPKNILSFGPGQGSLGDPTEESMRLPLPNSIGEGIGSVLPAIISGGIASSPRLSSALKTGAKAASEAPIQRYSVPGMLGGLAGFHAGGIMGLPWFERAEMGVAGAGLGSKIVPFARGLGQGLKYGEEPLFNKPEMFGGTKYTSPPQGYSQTTGTVQDPNFVPQNVSPPPSSPQGYSVTTGSVQDPNFVPTPIISPPPQGFSRVAGSIQDPNYTAPLSWGPSPKPQGYSRTTGSIQDPNFVAPSVSPPIHSQGHLETAGTIQDPNFVPAPTTSAVPPPQGYSVVPPEWRPGYVPPVDWQMSSKVPKLPPGAGPGNVFYMPSPSVDINPQIPLSLPAPGETPILTRGMHPMGAGPKVNPPSPRTVNLDPNLVKDVTSPRETAPVETPKADAPVAAAPDKKSVKSPSQVMDERRLATLQKKEILTDQEGKEIQNLIQKLHGKQIKEEAAPPPQKSTSAKEVIRKVNESKTEKVQSKTPQENEPVKSEGSKSSGATAPEETAKGTKSLDDVIAKSEPSWSPGKFISYAHLAKVADSLGMKTTTLGNNLHELGYKLEPSQYRSWGLKSKTKSGDYSNLEELLSESIKKILSKE